MTRTCIPFTSDTLLCLCVHLIGACIQVRPCFVSLFTSPEHAASSDLALSVCSPHQNTSNIGCLVLSVCSPHWNTFNIDRLALSVRSLHEDMSSIGRLALSVCCPHQNMSSINHIRRHVYLTKTSQIVVILRHLDSPHKNMHIRYRLGS